MALVGVVDLMAEDEHRPLNLGAFEAATIRGTSRVAGAIDIVLADSHRVMDFGDIRTGIRSTSTHIGNCVLFKIKTPR